MKPSAFEYYTPRSLDECVGLLVEHADDEPKLIAGGQSLVPLMNLRMARPEVLIDLNRLPDLAYIREEGGTLAIGALTRYADVEDSALIAERLPMLIRATAEVGYVAVRSRGTIGGAIAHADPVAEWPCLMLTLDAEMVAIGPNGRRTIAADDFFAGIFTTALEPTEVLTEIRIPLRREPGAWGFQEFARKAGDYAVVAVAVDLAVGDGAVTRARIGLSNLADRPVRAAALEQMAVGLPVGEVLEASLIEAMTEALGNEYDTEPARIDLAGVLVGRALNEALTAAKDGR
jgi:carbon-monoxide dehydrogenase medium subunit